MKNVKNNSGKRKGNIFTFIAFFPATVGKNSAFSPSFLKNFHSVSGV